MFRKALLRQPDPGQLTGKTHLSITLGYLATPRGMEVRVTRAADPALTLEPA